MAANAAAALDQRRFSHSDRARLARYARETSGDYCAGCGRICSEKLAEPLPVNDVMRCLMYLRAYQDPDLARTTFDKLPDNARSLLTGMDFTAAERSCPRRLPIGRLMQEAAALLA